ncbi:MAG: chemotaxis protein CheA [Spirochaetes bacterium]|nr:chemotaxis protein CheA [Spirochaetota bacterium]
MDISRLSETYKEEAHELLGKAEHCLIDLEHAPSDGEIINTIFRSLHTIKGSGSMFGFNRIAGFTHEFENLFDMIRTGAVTVTKDIIDLTLSACDHIRLLLGDETVPQTDTESLSFRLRNIIPASGKDVRLEPAAQHDTNALSTYRITFKPHETIFLRGINLVPIFDELHTFGTVIVSGCPGTMRLADMDPERCYASWTILLTTERSYNDIRTIFVFVEDDSDLAIDLIDSADMNPGDATYKRIGDILVERGDLTDEMLAAMLEGHKLIGEMAVEKGLVAPEAVDAALAEQSVVRSERSKRQNDTARMSIRVKSEKLDSLVNLAGEMVTLTARFNQRVSENGGESDVLVEMLTRLTDELRDTSMAMRMVPVEEMFSGYARLVRDLAKDLGKDIDLVTAGNDTELDKNIIEALKDPLMHIIRNAADHGIETPEARRAVGKDAQGTIRLSAEHAGAHVLITVSDDGGGLDRSRILKKAVERGLVKENAGLSAHEIEQMIFLPGFSTAEKTTSVSGRGVGMDIVKKNVEKLRGTVEIRSEAGKGTMFTLKIPLTLAIVDGLLARIGDDHFVLNISNIDECVDLTEDIVASGHGSEVVHFRGEIIPFVRLRKSFGIGGERPAVERMVVIRIGDRRIGLVVDDVLGKHQTVIKSLGSSFSGIDEVAGATILGDGTVALILDVTMIIQHTIDTADRGGGMAIRNIIGVS